MPSINLGSMTFSADAVESATKYVLGVSAPQTTLVSDINSSTTTIVVESSVGITNTSVIAIDNELMSVTNVVGGTLTVTRAAMSSTAAAHTGRVASVVGTGTSVRLSLFTSFVDMAKTILKRNIGIIMRQYPPTSITTHLSTVATAEAAINTLQTSSVT